MTRFGFAALFAGALAWASSAEAVVLDRIAAVVGDEVITLSEVYSLGSDFIEEAAASGPESRRSAELDVLDALIQRRLISQEINRLGLDVTDVELDRAIDDIASRNGFTREQLRVEVERSGLPWAQYREELQENLRQMKFNQTVVQPRITVNEDELLDAYKRLVRSAELPRIGTLGAIFIEVPPGAEEAVAVEAFERAAAAVARVRGGESFATVAAEVDESIYGANGGEMGTYNEGELVAELDGPAFAQDAGGTTDPIVMPGGVWVLHVFEMQRKDAPTFEAMREDVLQQVYAGRIDEETEVWTRQTRRRTAIDVKLEAPPAPFR